MVIIGTFMIVFSAIFVFGKIKKWKFISSNWFRWIIVAGAPLSIIALEAGWWLAEVGRQPWILYKYMKVADAATTSEHVDLMLMLFCLLYLVLGIGSVVVLLRMFRKNPIEKEIADRQADRSGAGL